MEKGPYWKGKTKQQVSKAIKNKIQSKEDWYLTAEDAVNYGFIDGIIGDKYKLGDLNVS